jgi:photosystem II stability/assembly factor-like uncharacterized protein
MRLFLLVLLTTCLFAQNPIPLNSGTTENLRGVSVVSDQIAWASGTHGTYLRTLDGGKTWHSAQVPGAEALDFRDLEAFSPDLAYLLAAGPGDQSRIYKTTDGGKNWALQFTDSDPKGFLDCMAFWDRDHGIAVGDPINGKFELLETNDGKTWRQIQSTSLPPAIEGEGAFAASGTCIAVQGKTNVWFGTGGKVSRVFRSTDRGKTWTVADSPILRGEASTGIFSVAFQDPRRGVIAGGDYKHPERAGPNLATTDDGGRTWKLLEFSPQAYFSAVAFDRKNHRQLALGSALTIEIRKKVASKLSDQNLNAISISRSGSAIAVGPRGLIVDMSETRPR